MKKFNKIKLATAIGTVALATALSVPANAAIVLGGDNGWEVSYGGFVNLFYTQSDWEFIGGGTEDSAHLNEGLLPAFHTLTAKSPEINGLKGTAQITFAPDSSSEKASRLNKSGVAGTGSNIDMREVFFSVSGDFGTITAGRTLALFQRQAILKDYTLFGVGALLAPDSGGTALGRIGYGYVYPDFRTQFKYTTPDINGFTLDIAIFDPQEPGLGGNAAETDTPQFQAEANYNTAFEGGSIGVWAGFLWQEMELFAAGGLAGGDITSFGYNIGVDVNFGGFNAMVSYYDGEALGTNLFNTNVSLAGRPDSFVCDATGCEEVDNDGFILQGAYTFNGTTKLGVSYGESNADAGKFAGLLDGTNKLWTVGVYHDVNSWLKVIAEYGNYSANVGLSGAVAPATDVDTFSIGGFLLW